jgi:hypothetical protein
MHATYSTPHIVLVSVTQTIPSEVRKLRDFLLRLSSDSSVSIVTRSRDRRWWTRDSIRDRGWHFLLSKASKAAVRVTQPLSVDVPAVIKPDLKLPERETTHRHLHCPCYVIFSILLDLFPLWYST